MVVLQALILGFVLDAAALSPPVGWTPAGIDRAVLDTSDASRGEILEVRLPQGTGDPKELVQALADRGVQVDRFGTDPDGAVNLVIKDIIGRARYQLGGDGIVWWVVLVSPNYARNLDPDAVIKAVAPSPEQMSWGAGKEAVQGGSDGSPWGAKGADTKKDGWISQVDVKAWTQDPVVAGVWEGSIRLRGISTRLWFQFENTGLLRIERQDKAGKTVDEGRWATRGGLIQMDIDNGGANVPYMSTGRTLSITYAGASITLYRK